MIAPQPIFEPRGNPIAVYHRAKVLTELGYKVDLLTYPLGKNIKIKGLKTYRTAKVPFITKVKVGPSYQKIVLDFFLLLKAIKLCKNKKYDAINVHEEISVFGGFFKRMFSVPVVYDMHSSMPQQLTNYNFTKNKAVIRLFKLLEKKAIRNADAVIAISTHLKEIADSIEKGKTSLIENTRTFKYHPSSKEVRDLRDKLGVKDQNIVLYTGTFEINQGLEMLLNGVPVVIKEKPSTMFVLVGGKRTQIETLKQKARRLGVEKNVIFLGQKSQKEVQVFTEAATVVVSPRSKGTNTPLKIYSYLKSGKPIVATNIHSHRQVLNHDVSILTKLDSFSFAEGMLALLRSKKLRKQVGTKGKIFAEKNFSDRMYKENVKTVYAPLFEKKSLKNILVLNYEYPPIGGGGSTVSKELAEKLARKGYSVDVVTMHFKGLKKFERINGVNIYRIPCLRKKKEVCTTAEMMSFVIKAIPSTLKLTRKKKYDMVHSHFIIPTSMVAYVLKKMRGLKYVITTHGSDVPGFNPDRFTFEHKLTKPLLRVIAKNAKLIVAPSHYLKNLVHKHIDGNAEILVIPNGTDPNKVRPTSQKKRWILMTGRLLPRKGFQHALKALSMVNLDGWHVHIAGDGPYRKKLEKIAKSFKEKVTFHGWLNNSSPKLNDLYKKSSIFCMPSSHENFSASLLEGMSSEMAVITTNATGCPETVGDTGFLTPAESPEMIAEALKKLLSNPNLVRKKGKEARKRVLENFDWNIVTNQYENALKNYGGLK